MTATPTTTAPMRPAPVRQAPVRHVRLAECRATIEPLADGAMLVRNVTPLGPYPTRITDCLDHWARVAPNRTWLAARDATGQWQRITYGEGHARVRRIASALLSRNLSPERPIVILSGNGLSHGLLATAALYAGIPYAAIAPAYATVTTDFAKLRAVLALLTPGLAFAADGAPFARALSETLAPDVEVVVEHNPPAGRPVTTFASFEAAEVTAVVDAARDRIGPDTLAKFLFTSGSTGTPKGVINTQRMLCANVEQATAHFAYWRDDPLVTLDWAPWNHTAGGNHNFNLILYTGGTLYIDDGRPMPGAILATVRNLRDISPNWYFNVPKGFEALLPHLRNDADLCRTFFKDLKLLWYAGAGMARHVWDELDALAIRTTGERITILTGLGSTETAPFAMAANQTMVDAGLIGLPGQGCELKLVPYEGKLEARVRGPNITPGYWRQPELSRAAFDADGFYKLGDALRFADPADVNRGFYFDGRIAEDFKLSTGTWVAVGPLRAAFIDHGAPYVQDVVLAGLDRDDITALIFADLAACRALCGNPDASLADVAADARVRETFTVLLRTFAANATGSSNRIARAVLVAQAPSMDSAEMTDKGSLNQRAVLRHRPQLVDDLYAMAPPPHVLLA